MAAVVPFYNDVLVNNQVGLSRNVDELSEKPKNFLDRVLLPGERVVKEFDCYFPSNFIPRWKLIALLILTCGLYCFVLLKRAIERWCYKHRCCTPAVVEFVRGKLVITDRFRVICWNTRTQQIKTGKGCCCGLCGELCAAPVIFDVDMEHRVYDANKIRQVAMYHSSQALCLFCCMMNESGISISFEEFVDVDGLFISSGSSSKFIHRVRSYLGTVQHYLGLTTNDHTVYITSGQMDAIHQGDSISTVVELSKLQEEILRVLPQQQDILVKNPALKSKDFSLVDDVSGFSMLDENKIRISTKWVHLAPGEQILSACMESYRMSCWDIILSVMTIGLFYLFYVKKRKQVGGILIVTNKRIVEIVTKCKKIGFIPVSLDNAFVSATSYYPGQINGGSMQSRGKNHRSLFCPPPFYFFS